MRAYDRQRSISSPVRSAPTAASTSSRIASARRRLRASVLEQNAAEEKWTSANTEHQPADVSFARPSDGYAANSGATPGVGSWPTDNSNQRPVLGSLIFSDELLHFCGRQNLVPSTFCFHFLCPILCLKPQLPLAIFPFERADVRVPHLLARPNVFAFQLSFE